MDDRAVKVLGANVVVELRNGGGCADPTIRAQCRVDVVEREHKLDDKCVQLARGEPAELLVALDVAPRERPEDEHSVLFSVLRDGLVDSVEPLDHEPPLTEVAKNPKGEEHHRPHHSLVHVFVVHAVTPQRGAKLCMVELQP